MFNIVLYQPEIPPNTGNIIRLCANTGCRLHLVEPLGFSMADKQLRRAGLDYHELANVEVYPDLESCLKKLDGGRIYAYSTKGQNNYTSVDYCTGDVLLFGPETRGLPLSLLDSLPPHQILRIPMKAGNRSLNLSNSAAIAVYEAMRQQGFTDVQ
ncbi:MAG: tRNA (uridine(34)/cytosine(34)/5-carboxymethylaminomethyluridine(34)-2'-O)-methyltransferase TrmL [Acidiferrobacterales bacterium]